MGKVNECEAQPEERALTGEFFEARKAELAERVSEKRFTHAMGVVKAADKLARTYGVDVRRARLAGLLHDWDKGYDDEGIRERAREVGISVDPWIFEHQPRLLHGPTAAAALGRAFPQIPADVLQAIDRHTTGVRRTAVSAASTSFARLSGRRRSKSCSWRCSAIGRFSSSNRGARSIRARAGCGTPTP